MRRSPEAARRYAKALFQLASAGEHDMKTEQTLKELRVLSAALRSDKSVEKFFLNPTVSKDEKKEILAELEAKLPSIYRFVGVLIDGGRLAELPAIVVEFEKLFEESVGELQVNLRVAHEMKSAQIDEIRQLLETEWKRRVRFTTSIHPELLGGFVAVASGRSMMASAQMQLDHLVESLSAGEK